MARVPGTARYFEVPQALGLGGGTCAPKARAVPHAEGKGGSARAIITKMLSGTVKTSRYRPRYRSRSATLREPSLTGGAARI